MKCHNYLYTRKNTRRSNPNIPNYNDLLSNVTQTSYYMSELATIYEFPQGDGSGQTIAVVELSGGYQRSDIDQILTLQNLPTNGYSITDVSVDGGTNNPGSDEGADQENALDVQNVVSIAPKCSIRVYFAPNSDASFLNAVARAGIIDKVKIIVIAWGKPESQWDTGMLNQFNAMLEECSNLGCTIFVASGDRGSSDGTSGTVVDFPASSPYVCGVGGTSLQSENGVRISEYVWNTQSDTSATGGGLSDHFTTPAFQSSNSSFNFQGKRGVPDYSGPADPHLCGSNVYIATQGGLLVIGGTSAVAPFWGGLAARFNQLISPRKLGFLNPILYPFPDTLFYDIIVGNNGEYQAQQYWDACTGNGSPIGTRILAMLQDPNAPKAEFSASSNEGNSPLKVSFVDGSSGMPLSWLWDFGTGGSTSTEQNPMFTFELTNGLDTQIFNVSLTVKNGSGASAIVHTITVNQSDPFPIWAIVLIVVVIFLCFVLGLYFGLHHKRQTKR